MYVKRKLKKEKKNLASLAHLIETLAHIKLTTVSLFAINPILNNNLNFRLFRINQSETSDISTTIFKLIQIDTVQILKNKKINIYTNINKYTSKKKNNFSKFSRIYLSR